LNCIECATGPTGKNGTKGEQGKVGIQGKQGVKGEMGAKGVTGSKGDIGLTGLKGNIGENGIQGKDGVAGSDGKNGQQGIKGKTGLQGVKGDKGETGLLGAKGNKGAKGEKGVIGKQGKDGQSGVDGKAGNVGKDGEKGSKGDIGIPGTNGKNGTQGKKGETGLPGKDGRQGMQGIQGNIGPTGETGTKGNTGKDGTTGKKGEKGDSVSIESNPLKNILSKLSTLQKEIVVLKYENKKYKETVDGNNKLKPSYLPDGYNKHSVYDLQWHSLHFTVAVACRGSNEGRRKKISRTFALVKKSGESCYTVCKKVDAYCHDGISLYATSTKSTNYTEPVASYQYNGCKQVLSFGDEILQADKDIMEEKPWNYCCCYNSKNKPTWWSRKSN